MQTMHGTSSHTSRKRRLPAVFLTLFADLLLIGGGLCLFALFHHVLPQRFNSKPLYSEDNLQQGEGSFTLPGITAGGKHPSANGSGEAQGNTSESPSAAADSGIASSEDIQGGPITPDDLFAYIQTQKRYGESPFFDRTNSPLGCYLGENAMIAITEHSMGDEDNRIAYYAADIFISSTRTLETYVCQDENGDVCDGSIEEVAEAANAVFAVNTDYFKSRSWGYYVRNGVEYLAERTGNDVCVIYLDGSMEILREGNVDYDALSKKGIWQMFTFGPSLFDENGKPYTSTSEMNITSTYQFAYDSTSFYGFQSPNPRTALGYVEPGHYVIITIDGRQEGYSRGATLVETAQILYDEGCTLAYNLDGGGSSQMYFAGDMVNFRARGRSPSDYLVIGGSGSAYWLENDQWKEVEP